MNKTYTITINNLTESDMRDIFYEAIENAKMWSNSCKACGKMSTTDNYKCPHCGEVKNAKVRI